MAEYFESCGLLATFIATLMEGEVFFITAIISSKLGAFSTKGALIVGFLGSYTQGWFKYYIAKNHGRKLLKKREKLNSKIEKYSVWFSKHPILYLTIYKFLFGLTTVILFLSGLKNIGYLKFAIFSAISSLMWVAVLGSAAYYYADTVLNAFEFLGMYKHHIIGVLIVVGIIVFYVRHRINLHCCVQAVIES